MSASDPGVPMLRHTLATLAYRAGKALRDTPDGFGDFRPVEGGRKAVEILAHMGDLFDWALTMAEGDAVWNESPPLPWDAEVARFFAALERFDARLAREATPAQPATLIFQGPVADALTHTGQLAMMRRMAGAKMRGENYFRADIVAGRVGEKQAPPKREFD